MKVVPDDGIWVSDFKSKTKKLLKEFANSFRYSDLSKLKKLV